VTFVIARWPSLRGGDKAKKLRGGDRYTWVSRRICLNFSEDAAGRMPPPRWRHLGNVSLHRK